MKLRIFCFLVVFSLFPGIVSAQSAGAATLEIQAFDRGITAFRAGDYHAALQSFLDARRAGLATSGLTYNIGVAYYRLQRYAEAEREFLTLAREPEWAALAHYNLGLITQRMGREQQAMEHFERVLRTSADPKLHALASTALERLGGAPLPPRTAILVSLAGGYDSNATISSNAGTLEISDKSGLFVEAFAAGTHHLAGNSARGWHIDGALVLRKYSDLDQFDQIASRVGLSYKTDSGRSQTSVGGYFDLIYVDGKRLEQAAVADMQARRRLEAGGDVLWRYQLGRIDGGGGYEYLDGWRHRITMDAGSAWTPVLLRVGYEFEYNDREDLRQGSEFSSYSPTRHMLFASMTWPEVGGWRTDARGEYQMSRYNDPDRLDGGTREVTREDTGYSVFARASRRWTGVWRLFIDYSYYRNNSNLDAYDYHRHQFLTGIVALF